MKGLGVRASEGRRRRPAQSQGRDGTGACRSRQGAPRRYPVCLPSEERSVKRSLLGELTKHETCVIAKHTRLFHTDLYKVGVCIYTFKSKTSKYFPFCLNFISHVCWDISHKTASPGPL